MMLIKELKLNFFTEEYSRSMTSKLPFFYRKRTAADVGLIPIGSRLLFGNVNQFHPPFQKCLFNCQSKFFICNSFLQNAFIGNCNSPWTWNIYKILKWIHPIDQYIYCFSYLPVILTTFPMIFFHEFSSLTCLLVILQCLETRWAQQLPERRTVWRDEHTGQTERPEVWLPQPFHLRAIPS